MSEYFFRWQYFQEQIVTVLDPIDKYAIGKVKEKRIAMGYSQAQLANELDVSVGFIGMVESKKFVHKYSLSQLNKIAKILKCSPKDFIPDNPL